MSCFRTCMGAGLRRLFASITTTPSSAVLPLIDATAPPAAARGLAIATRTLANTDGVEVGGTRRLREIVMGTGELAS